MAGHTWSRVAPAQQAGAQSSVTAKDKKKRCFFHVNKTRCW